MTRQHSRGFSTLVLLAGLVIGLVLAVAQHANAQTQERLWVQIESLSDLATAQQRARAYAQIVDNVNAFRANTGLYAIVAGPYDEGQAQIILQRLLAQGVVPRDSFLTNGVTYVSQFYPVGGTALADVAAGTAPADAAPVTPAATVIPEETPQQARQSEAQLTRAERDALQIALQWFGFYNAGIDGAFGPGTRRAMQLYQEARAMEQTGVLTTRQRAQLLGEYQGELAGLGMQRVRDERAGIEIDMPLGMVEFARHNFPFAQFDSIDDSGVQVLLISQPGDQGTLFGLYEIMQTLEIVPLDGDRNRGRDSFVLTGQSETLRSHTEARLVNGTVKGFTLVWPPARDQQMERVLPMMQGSISYFGGALDPTAIPEGLGEDIDMVSGLDVRRPELVRTGFFVDGRGTVLTTSEIARQCADVLINDIYRADITLSDPALGLAVLAPQQRLAPVAFAQFATAPGRLRSEIAVSGFPFGGAISAASMSFGELADLRGVNGEDGIQRLAVTTAETEAGGPVMDLAGSVIGMVLPGNASGRALPDEVTLALRGDQLGPVLANAGVTLTQSTRQGAMNRDNLARYGADMTVTVSCWN
jgi:peptidoglycan hydrolase-like protein with peptidoglycan-binding domain